MTLNVQQKLVERCSALFAWIDRRFTVSRRYHRVLVGVKLLALKVKAGLFEIAVFGAYLCAFFVLTPELQNKSFGPLWWSIGLSAFIWFVVFLVENSEDRLDLEALILQTSFLRHKYLHMAAVFTLVMVASYAQNSSVYGAVSPVDYWKSEWFELTTSCNGLAQVAAIAAEDLQIAQNKQRLGISTTQEMLSSIQSAKIMFDLYNDCTENAKRRSREIGDNFKRLGIG